MNEVANGFNSFFINVGPNLAKTIEKHNDGAVQSGWKGGNQVLQSMLLGDVSENEIVSVVTKLKNKRPIDSEGTDMIIVKKTDCVIKPLCYVFNLSFQTATFPNRMKEAKVIPLFKTGDKHSFTNYRPVSLLL